MIQITGRIDREPEAGRFTLWVDGREIAYLNWLIVDARDDDVRIADIFIEDKGDRGKGYGRMLVEHFEEAARLEGFTRVRLILVEDEALEFWRRMGYEWRIGKGIYKDLAPRK